MQKILVIDDDRDMCMLLNRFLTKHGFDVKEVYNGKNAIMFMEKEKPDLVLCDFRLDDIDGKQLLVKTRELYPDIPFIIITGYADVKLAVEVLKLGAYDYVTKPVFPDEILVTIKKALNSPGDILPKISPRTVVTSKAIKLKPPEKYIFSDSPEIQQIIRQVELVAPTNYSVIIYGESGSGKEAIASRIHEQSKRKGNPFIAIDCGALSKELAGSELFGHEKGAFTGAINQKIGSLELADGGTVFLDEVSNLPYDVQVSLLRVVQERKMRRVGGNNDIILNIRIIVASNEKLWEFARNGKFREDLFHRFNEFSINLLPLRERKNEIIMYARHFLAIANSELGKQIDDFSRDVQKVLINYPWYGNLRELQNVVKRSALLTDTNQVEIQALPFEITFYEKLNFEQLVHPTAENRHESTPDEIEKTSTPLITDQSLKMSSIDAEYETIVKALRQSNFNKSKAARILNIDRKTLYNKLKEYKQFKNQ